MGSLQAPQAVGYSQTGSDMLLTLTLHISLLFEGAEPLLPNSSELTSWKYNGTVVYCYSHRPPST